MSLTLPPFRGTPSRNVHATGYPVVGNMSNRDRPQGKPLEPRTRVRPKTSLSRHRTWSTASPPDLKMRS